MSIAAPDTARCSPARRRLGDSPRWSAAEADLGSSAWSGRIAPGTYDAIVSAYAIHHLPSARGRELPGEASRLLSPGGIFVNMDHVTIAGPLTGLYEEQLHERRTGPEHQPVEHGENRPDSRSDQLRWLTEAGLSNTEVHFKWAEAAVYGATKPTEGDE